MRLSPLCLAISLTWLAGCQQRQSRAELDAVTVEVSTINAMLASSPPPQPDTERYEAHADNPIHQVANDPVSTFSIDVDTGSYSNVRRMLLAGQCPHRAIVTT